MEDINQYQKIKISKATELVEAQAKLDEVLSDTSKFESALGRVQSELEKVERAKGVQLIMCTCVYVCACVHNVRVGVRGECM